MRELWRIKVLLGVSDDSCVLGFLSEPDNCSARPRGFFYFYDNEADSGMCHGWNSN